MKWSLNKIIREIEFMEHSELSPGHYQVEVDFCKDLDFLNKNKLLTDLKEEGLEYSGITYITAYGFNDKSFFNNKEINNLKDKKISTIWVGLGDYHVSLDIQPVIFNKLYPDNHINYAQKILEKIVTFVENPKCYINNWKI